MAEDFWSEARTAELITIWNDDWPSQRIATHLGISRNAVVGKIYRLRRAGVILRTERPHIDMLRSRVRKRATRLISKMRLPPQPATARQIFLAKLQAEAREGAKLLAQQGSDIPRKGLLDLEEGDCRWPCGDRPHKFCAAPAIAGLPYCESHARRAFVPAQVQAVGSRQLAVGAKKELVPA